MLTCIERSNPSCRKLLYNCLGLSLLLVGTFLANIQRKVRPTFIDSPLHQLLISLHRIRRAFVNAQKDQVWLRDARVIFFNHFLFGFIENSRGYKFLNIFVFGMV